MPFMTRNLLSYLLLTLHMAQSSVSVPLHQFGASQSVLEAYTSDHDIDGLGAQLPSPSPVSLPVNNPTKSFWTDSPGANLLATEGSHGELTAEADVCIIGAGITGVSAAYHLSGELGDLVSSPKRTVVVLEARDFCSGATGRNGGHLTPSIFLDFHRRATLYGTLEAIESFKLENYTSKSLVQLIRDTQDDPLFQNESANVGLVHGRHVSLLFTKEEEESARRDYESAKAAGLGGLDDVTWVDKEDMSKTRGASFPGVETEGHNLWPLKLVTRLFLLAQRRSSNVDVKIHTHTPVTAVSTIKSSDGKKQFIVSTPRGDVRCSYVLHATNAYANHLLQAKATGIQVVPTRGQIIGTRAAVRQDRVGKSSWSGNDGFEYWFPRPVNVQTENPLVILGGGREVTGPQFEFYQTNDAEVNPSVGEALSKFLPGIFPSIYPSVATVEWEWTGIMGYTRSGNPFVGPVPGEDGQYISAGYTGHGMPRAYACGEAVAGMIAGQLLKRKWTKPEWLPDHYLTASPSGSEA
ncbi:DAO-domain-containing protein [Coprinopsis marcescibilis]|uniref:DAO-domain-containing protein n=1 Tax=Coprinopsis marcescibilis TaxID=230819 RepID=A0A5C3L070_COPMA|nr:DAO-domain-containing protein [Coprinopsis marcescibilis]